METLPEDQRTVLELVLRQGQGYDQVAATLGIDRAAVRRRALDAFDALGPQTPVAPLQRALITDYLLGQLPSRVAEQVHASLGASDADRDWAAAVSAELAPLAGGRLPEIPGVSAVGPTGVVGPTDSGSAQPEPAPRSSRTGGAILIAVGAAVAIAAVAVIVVFVTGGFSGGGSSGDQQAAAVPAPAATQPAQTRTTQSPAGTTQPPGGTTPAATTPTRVHQVNLTAPGGARRPIGVAQVLRQGNAIGLAIVATGVPANTSTNAYGVWLASSGSRTEFLGFVPRRVGDSGRLTVTSASLPMDARSFSQLLITVETTAHPKSPGQVLLSGAFAVP